MPRTGRTHQIRVHLQYLGHPIINDPLYNDFVWGPDKGKGGVYGKTDDQVIVINALQILEGHYLSLGIFKNVLQSYARFWIAHARLDSIILIVSGTF